MAAYVKSLEAAGARVIPILYNEPMAIYLTSSRELMVSYFQVEV